MRPGEMLVDQAEEGSCNICLDISAVWGVKPNDVPWSVSAITIRRDVVPDVCKAFTIATGLGGIILDF